MRYLLMTIWLVLASVTSAAVQVSVGVALPGISIGINLPRYPELVLVSGYPVYYAPHLDLNYFFYDGMYWVFVEDDWYVSYWYNGPWYIVYPDYVPVFILRVPVYYYRRPPVYFYGWWLGGPPHWEKRWGRDWERRRGAWRHWDLSATPPPAPLPDYQRDYRDNYYPDRSRQIDLHKRHYRYQPRDSIVREHFRRMEERPERTPQGQSEVRPQGREWGSPLLQRGRVIVPPPERGEARPDRDSPQRWQRDSRESEPMVPPMLQRQRTIRMIERDEGRRQNETAPEERRYRGGRVIQQEDERRSSNRGEKQQQEERPREGREQMDGRWNNDWDGRGR